MSPQRGRPRPPEELRRRHEECAAWLRDDLYRLAPADNPGGKYDRRSKWVYENPPQTRFVVLEILHERSLTGAILDADGKTLSITTGADPYWLDEVLP